MGEPDSCGDFASFVTWANRQGIRSTGMAPGRLTGRGFGIVATTEVEMGQSILFVPTTALLTAITIPKKISEAICKDTTVHGLLAAWLCLDAIGPGKPTWSEWRAIWPSHRDIKESMPLLWEEELRRLLPAAAKDLLQVQQEKLERDYSAVSAGFPHLTRDGYTYNWLLVNTRTFYHFPGQSSSGKRRKQATSLARDDRIALCPFADCFNHADQGCPVTFQTNGFTISADRSYGIGPLKSLICTPRSLIQREVRGEEMCISYGSHPTDFLLTEYGFAPPLENNKNDRIPLQISFSEEQQILLKDAGYSDDYVLDSHSREVCFRTQVALRCPPMTTEGKWRRFIDGLSDGRDEQAAVDREIFNFLVAMQAGANGTLKALTCICEGMTGRSALLQRWTEIRTILDDATEHYRS